MQHLGDITKIIGAEIPVVDCIIGGSPCQDLSQAGRRAGLAGERSGLFMEQIRIVKEMRERDRGLHSGRTDVSIRPRYMVWENVPGAFSSNKGEDFRCVLETVARVCEESVTIPRPKKGKWSQSGVIIGDSYSIAWRVFDAQYWGVPQRRKRICLVADFNGHSAAEIVFNEAKQHGCTEQCSSKPSDGYIGTESRSEVQPISEGLPRYPESSREKREEASTYAEGSLGTGDPVIYDARGNGDGKIVPTMTGDHQNRITDYTGVVVSFDRETFNAGQSFSQTLGIHEYGIQPTLVSMGSGGVAYGVNGDVAGTIDSSYYKGCGMRNGLERDFVVQQEPYQDTVGTIMSKMSEGYCGQDAYNDMFIIEKVKAVDCRNCTEDDVNCTLQHASYRNLNSNNVVRVRYVVRRLTPLECERLQGLPDNWTNIGEWVDSSGKKRKLADSHRYKAIGNGIALPSWAWVLKRLCSHYERPCTLGSLFDGLGSFPLIWEQINGKGSCLWASEIDDFCIAVTKERFS